MVKSAEYSDLTWVTPNAFGSGRDGKAVRYIVIHYTAGAERNTSAEDGAAYDARRTDGVSTHYFVDSNSVVQCVKTSDRANAARSKGNRLGIQYELCGTQQTRAQWLDAASLPTLQNAAKQVARDCKKYNIPVKRLSVAQTRAAWYDYPNGPKGIVGHVDCTNAYPEDSGDHTDPGPQFPWDLFLPMVQTELDKLKGNPVSEANPTLTEIKAAVKGELVAWGKIDPIATLMVRTDSATNRQLPATTKALAEIKEQIALLATMISRVDGIDGPELDQLAAKVTASLSDSMAAALAQKLAERLAQ